MVEIFYLTKVSNYNDIVMLHNLVSHFKTQVFTFPKYLSNISDLKLSNKLHILL